MRKLSREEKRIVIRLFNRLFSIESKTRMLKNLFSTITTEINMCRGNEMKVNEIFDRYFTIEDKIIGISFSYQMKGYKFKTAEEIIENRYLLEENEICTDWKTRRERTKQKPCYV